MFRKFYNKMFETLVNWYFLFGNEPRIAKFSVAIIQGFHVFLMIQTMSEILWGDHRLRLVSAFFEFPGAIALDLYTIVAVLMLYNNFYYDKKFVDEISKRFIESKTQMIPRLILYVVIPICAGMIGLGIVF